MLFRLLKKESSAELAILVDNNLQQANIPQINLPA
jgi:hypothetical protein